MLSKRAVLQQFKRDELLAAVDRFGLEVHDRRVRDQLVDALAGSRKAHLADILGDLSRDQLKAICRALDLDDTGREKAVLIARLAGTAEHGSTPPQVLAAEPSKEKPAPPPKLAAPKSARSTETAANLGFEAKLWRGRRASRQHGRRRVQARRPRPDLPQVHLRRLRGASTPSSTRSRRRAPTRKTRTSTAPRTSSGCRRRPAGRTCRRNAPQPTIGTAHRRRDGRHRARQPVAQGRAAQGLRPPRPRQAAARRADRPGQRHRPRRARPTAPRTCSAASTSTSSSQFASAEGKKRRPVLHAALRRARAGRDARALQGPRLRPLLRLGRHVRAVREVRRGARRPASATSRIYGQESNHTTWRLAKMNLAIRGIDAHIAHGDTFHNDQHPDLKADFVLANPPFNVSDWRGELLRDDKRWAYGAPPAGNANFAWVQHFIHHLAPDRHRRLRAGQRLDVVEPVGRGRDPQGDRRGRPRRLHGRAAGPALLLDADSGLPLVPRPRQAERPLPRPPRRDAVHRRPQARHAWSTAPTAS